MAGISRWSTVTKSIGRPPDPCSNPLKSVPLRLSKVQVRGSFPRSSLIIESRNIMAGHTLDCVLSGHSDAPLIFIKIRK